MTDYESFPIDHAMNMCTSTGTQILNLNPLTWKIWAAPNNASRWQMGFNSAFKGLMSATAVIIFRETSYGFQVPLPGITQYKNTLKYYTTYTVHSCRDSIKAYPYETLNPYRS